ncbi:MAG: hypothetical protein M0019_08850 [Actinomycetota bacterium]|nr:hypothetical protein [Actinomycetota bacterium]
MASSLEALSRNRPFNHLTPRPWLHLNHWARGVTIEKEPDSNYGLSLPRGFNQTVSTNCYIVQINGGDSQLGYLFELLFVKG